jgi:DNA-binding response OmpR family regulator
MQRILVIEDDEAVRKLVIRHLVAAGYEVQEADNGKTGLASYRQQQSDLVITDIVMPETEGLEAIRELRRVNPEVKIIAMSGAVGGRADRYLGLAMGFGALRILSKPFTGADLLSVVAEVLTAE